MRYFCIDNKVIYPTSAKTKRIMKSTKKIIATLVVATLATANVYSNTIHNYSNTFFGAEEKVKKVAIVQLLPSLAMEEVMVPEPVVALDFNQKYSPSQMAAIVGLWGASTQSVPATPEVPVKEDVTTAPEFPGLEASAPVEKTYSPEELATVLEIKF